MDAKEYDRIADLLMQIRTKFKTIKPKQEPEQKLHRYLMMTLDDLIKYNDKFAEWDAKGWL